MSDGNKLSRREFIKDAAIASAAVAGAGVLGTTPAQAQTQCPPTGVPAKWDLEADVVVVGYGGAGAVTAMTAHDAGAKVLILEKQPDDTPTEVRHTCSTRNAGGGGSVWVGSEEDALKFLRWATKGMVPDDVMKAYIGKWMTLDKWMVSIGGKPVITERGSGEFAKDAPGFAGGDSWRSIRFDPPTNASAVAWRLYEKNVREIRKIEVKFETPAKRLITEPVSGQVLGVEATSGGKSIFVKAKKAVVLACGGFQHNDQLKKEGFRGVRFEFYANPGNTGDGVVMAQAAGADLWHMACAAGRINIARFPGTPTGQSAAVTKRKMVVDQYGKRFVDEGEIEGGHSSWTEASHVDTVRAEYPRNPAWFVFDQKRLEEGPVCELTKKGQLPNGTQQFHGTWSKDNSAEIAKGWILKGDTLEGLVAAIKVDPENAGRMDAATLKDTLTKYNQYCATGVDAEFHRAKESLVALTTPPYYAFKIYPGGPNTWGGPRKNGKCQVLRADGTAIPRLYCVGELGSINTLSYPVNNFYECSFSGRIAGENVVLEKPWDASA